MNQKVIFIKGLPGSGKTTWAREMMAAFPGYRRINKDDIRAMIGNGEYTSEKETSTIHARNALLRAFLKDGKTVIIDDTNLNPAHEKAIRTVASEFGVPVEVESFLEVPIEKCIENDAGRENPVGEGVIRWMYHKWIEKKPYNKKHKPIWVERNYLKQRHLKDFLDDAIIVDLDGTLALMDGRSPYDWSRVGEDRVNRPVADIVRDEKRRGTKIIIVTGRDGSAELMSKGWLTKYNIPYDAFFIRPTGDYRPDSEIKREIFENYIKGQYYVKYVLDDRDSVVEEWRKIGLLCLQVAPGNF